MQLVLFALQIIKKSFYAVKFVGRIALQYQPALVDGEVTPRNIGGNSLPARPFFGFLQQAAITGLRPGLNCSIVERLAGIRNDEIEIEIDGVAKPLAARARAVGIVERKQPRLRLLIDGSVIFALEAVVEDHALRWVPCPVGDEFQNRFTATFAIANFDGVN